MDRREFGCWERGGIVTLLLQSNKRSGVRNAVHMAGCDRPHPEKRLKKLFHPRRFNRICTARPQVFHSLTVGGPRRTLGSHETVPHGRHGARLAGRRRPPPCSSWCAANGRGPGCRSTGSAVPRHAEAAPPRTAGPPPAGVRGAPSQTPAPPPPAPGGVRRAGLSPPAAPAAVTGAPLAPPSRVFRKDQTSLVRYGEMARPD